MESLTTLRTIQMSRKDANNFRLKCLVDRSDLACPGPVITLKDVSFSKAVKMIKTGTLEVLIPGTKDEWIHIPNGDYEGLKEAYTDKVVTPEELEIIVTNSKSEDIAPIYNKVNVEEFVDESDDDENTVDESDTEETIEDSVVEDEQEVEEEVINETSQETEESTTEEVTTESTETIQRVAAVPANDYNTSKHNNNYNKYNKKKK